MWAANGSTLTMTEGDFGVIVPVRITGADFESGDGVRFTFKSALNGSTLFEKDFTTITDNTVSLMLSAEESAKLAAGSYVYSLDWYRGDSFLCNIVPAGKLKVVDKA